MVVCVCVLVVAIHRGWEVVSNSGIGARSLCRFRMLPSNSVGSWSGDTGIEESMTAVCIGGVFLMGVTALTDSSSDDSSLGARNAVLDGPGEAGAGVVCLESTGDLDNGDSVRMLSRRRRDGVAGEPVKVGRISSAYSSSVGLRNPSLCCPFDNLRLNQVEYVFVASS